jgi:hypothetical protein
MVRPGVKKRKKGLSRITPRRHSSGILLHGRVGFLLVRSRPGGRLAGAFVSKGKEFSLKEKFHVFSSAWLYFFRVFITPGSETFQAFARDDFFRALTKTNITSWNFNQELVE